MNEICKVTWIRKQRKTKTKMEARPNGDTKSPKALIVTKNKKRTLCNL